MLRVNSLSCQKYCKVCGSQVCFLPEFWQPRFLVLEPSIAFCWSMMTGFDLGGHQHLAGQTGLLVTPGGFVSRNGCFIRRRVGAALRDLAAWWEQLRKLVEAEHSIQTHSLDFLERSSTVAVDGFGWFWHIFIIFHIFSFRAHEQITSELRLGRFHPCALQDGAKDGLPAFGMVDNSVA